MKLMPVITSTLACRTLIGLACYSLAGCSYLSTLLPGGQAEYRTQGNANLPALEVPPDLTSPTVDDRFVIPNIKPGAQGGAVLPKFDGVRIERAGDQRWLVVKATPDQAWVVAKEFWLGNGFILKRETPEAGMLETDWAENRSKIPQDIVRNTLGKLIDGAYSTPERDKFRTRLERGSEAGTTDIHISHQGMVEVFNQSRDATLWQPRPTDKDLELEMLGRLLAKFSPAAAAGAGSTANLANTAAGTSTPATAAINSTTPASAARASLSNDQLLKLNEPFDRAWRSVGVALDRAGFTVEDRDRSKGVYFVRYLDPDTAKTDSIWDKLAFWRTAKADNRPPYRITVTEKEGVTNVAVQNDKAEAENSPTSKRMLSLLLDQLK